MLLQREPYRAICLVCIETCAENNYEFHSQFAEASIKFVEKHGGLKDKVAETVLDLLMNQPEKVVETVLDDACEQNK